MKIKRLFSIFSALLILTLCFSSARIEALLAVSTSPTIDPDIEESLSPSEIRDLIPKLENTDNILISKEECNSNELAEFDLAIKTGTDYGYKDMELRSNSEGRKKLYQKLITSMENVWNSEIDSMKMDNIYLGTFYVMDMFIMEDYGVTFDEASAVYETFRHDNPIFYYASNVLMGFPVSDTQTYLIITCYEDFYEQSVKQKYNAKIQSYIDSYASCVMGRSIYEDAKAIHDKLILSMDYAYSDDGITPSATGVAHSIIGAIEGAGTCDTYAKTYQLLCNYYEIENVFVTGTVNGGHSWNAVKLDDGKYYFVDCTGDDLGDKAGYTYFAVGTETLYQTHVINTPEGIGADFLYLLPKISKVNYSIANMYIKGDINNDGKLNVSDVVLMQKWLLAVPGIKLEDWKAGDLCEDEQLDAFDLCLMKRLLIYSQA